MLLAMKTRNVIGAFRSVYLSQLNSRLFVGQIIGCPVILS